MFSFTVPEKLNLQESIAPNYCGEYGEVENRFEEIDGSLQTEERRAEIESAIQEQAQDLYLDDQLAAELRESFETDACTGDNANHLVSADADAEAHSPRILELRHRQRSCREMRQLINKSLKTLTEIGEGTDTVLDYLLNSEPELAHFELLESQHAKLREMSIQLAERSIDLKARLANQEHEIEILEALKKRMRGIIERSKTEIARINEKREEQISSMAAREITINRLGQEKNLLREKNLHLEARCKDAEAELENKYRDIEASREKISMLQNQLKIHEKQTENLIEERDQFLQKARSIMTDYDELQRSHRETLSKLEESVHSEEALRKEYEEKLKIKDARILKLESSNGVLSNQVLISGEVIASLNAKLEEEAHHEAQPQPSKDVHHV